MRKTNGYYGMILPPSDDRTDIRTGTNANRSIFPDMIEYGPICILPSDQKPFLRPDWDFVVLRLQHLTTLQMFQSGIYTLEKLYELEGTKRSYTLLTKETNYRKPAQLEQWARGDDTYTLGLDDLIALRMALDF